VLRQRLIETLAQRWSSRLIMIEAPAGYGKSTALAQAIRDNEGDPSGFDIFVRLRSSTHDAAEVLTALASQLGAVEAASVESLSDAIGAQSPNDVAVVIDDMHLAEDVAGLADVVSELLDALPSNGHLVISGRSLPQLKTARLAASDQLVRIGRDDLAFTSGEAAELASAHGVDGAAVERTDGWPALTRLAIASGRDRPTDFLIEEIADVLDPEDRQALALAIIAAPAAPALLRSAGVVASLSELMHRVPLLCETDGGLSAHDLWHEASEALFTGVPVGELARTIRHYLSSNGEHHRALTVALAHELWEEALSEIVEAMIAGDAAVDVLLTKSWLDALPAEYREHPEAQLLRGFHARLSGDVTAGTDEIRAAADVFEANGRLDAAASAVNELGLRGWMLGDSSLWKESGERSKRLMAAGSRRMLELSAVGTVGRRELRGDFAGAIRAYEERPGFLDDPDEMGARHCSTLAFLAGDIKRCRHYLDVLVQRWPKRLLEGQRRLVFWQLGDPEPLLAYGAHDHGSFTNQRNELLAAVFSSLVRSNVGLSIDADEVEALAWNRSREQTYVALVRAAAEIQQDANESEIALRFDARLAAIGHDDPLLRGELRRFVAYAYVLSAAARERLDADEGWGPVFESSRDLARAFCRARSGGPVGTLPPNTSILTWLPLPWSIELACRMAAQGDSRGTSLVEYLADTCGSVVHLRLRRLIDHVDDDSVRRGAEEVLSAVPSPPDAPVVVNVLDIVSVTHSNSAPAQIARARVRQLLQLLAVRDRWTREALVDALWPDLPPDKGRANLRATLAHLRRELEPERTAGEAPFHLRQRGDDVWLHRSEQLDLDLWELRSALRSGGDRSDDSTLASLRTALESWTERSLSDIRDIEIVAIDVQELQRQLLTAGCRASEQLLATGDTDQAIELAELVLAIDRTDERGHNALIGALLGARDLDRAELAIVACLDAVASLGVDISGGTKMLVRRFERRSGRVILDQRTA
jgi:LuxR family maltose regulon positive regulatory protein